MSPHGIQRCNRTTLGRGLRLATVRKDEAAIRVSSDVAPMRADVVGTRPIQAGLTVRDYHLRVDLGLGLTGLHAMIPKIALSANSGSWFTTRMRAAMVGSVRFL